MKSGINNILNIILNIKESKNINCRGEFQFYNVGQGLFYTGTIMIVQNINYNAKAEIDISNKSINFSFVYDCGSFNKDCLKKCVNEFINITKNMKNKNVNFKLTFPFLILDTSLPIDKNNVTVNIDIIFLSHLHYDHINGIDDLLQRINKVEYIILPYFTPIQRLAIALDVIKNIPNILREEWYFKFLSDPVDYLLSRFDNKIGKIILITGCSPEEKENEKPSRDFPRDIDNLRDKNFEKYIDIKLRDETERIKNKICLEEKIQDEDKEDKHKNKIDIKRSDGYILFLLKNNRYKIPLWFFKLFYLKVSDDKLKEFEKCVNELCEKYKINNNKQLIIEICKDKNKNMRDDLIECYKKIKSEINETSLVVYHAPDESIIKKINKCILKYVYDNVSKSVECKGCGQLLTGDINLKDETNYTTFLNYYKNYCNNICLLQIPHHGSINNWNSKILQDFSNIEIFVASAGQKNNYGHPNDELTKYISKERCKEFKWVDENRNLRLFINIDL